MSKHKRDNNKRNNMNDNKINKQDPQIENAAEEKKEANATSDSINDNAEGKIVENAVDKRITELETKAESLEGSLLEEKDKYLRLVAEFDTFRRRGAKERLDLINTASEEVIKGLLPILDDFKRALTVLKDSKDAPAAIEGTELIYNKLFNYLKSKGLKLIEALGKDFDTDDQEAVAQMPVDDKSKKNKVIDVIQDGYLLNGKVIRFAKVVIGI